MDQLTKEQREIGVGNYNEAIGVTRRDFLQGVLKAGAVSGAGLGAMYFGYNQPTNPVRVGVIGTGDEGNVLIGGCTPEYVHIAAIADIRPYSIHRAFHGDWSSDAALAARPGIIKRQKYSSYDEAAKNVKVYDGNNGGIQALLDDKSIQAVIIALPLHLHGPIAVQAMLRGKHVLTEKLMAHNVAQCKVMAKVANDTKLHCATGHQRHYSVLYDNAVHLLRWGMLGQLHHIRAQWHRGNLPGNDSWQPWLPGGEIGPDGKKVDRVARQLQNFRNQLSNEKSLASPAEAELLMKKIDQWEAWMNDKDIKPEDFGYISMRLSDGRERTAMEELIRWRLWQRTGGGLMAELGSHQLDASSIFCSALRADGSKAHPLTVHAVGGRHIFPVDREAEDHVYCTYEFPGPEYDATFDVGYPKPPGKGIDPYTKDPNKKIVVTYSSINGNGFGGYGEVVLGTKGTMILEKEQEIMLYASGDASASVGIRSTGSSATMDTQASGGTVASMAKAANSGPISKGYTEEIEHWAYCIQNPSPENKPKCHPVVAMGDAVIALTTNVAIANGNKGKGGYIQFDESWFDPESHATPDGSSFDDEYKRLTEYKV